MSTNKDYSRGYAAGRRRLNRETAKEKQNEFWRQAYLAAMSEMVTKGDTWKIGDKSVTTVAARSQIAKSFADEALKIAINGGRL